MDFTNSCVKYLHSELKSLKLWYHKNCYFILFEVIHFTLVSLYFTHLHGNRNNAFCHTYWNAILRLSDTTTKSPVTTTTRATTTNNVPVTTTTPQDYTTTTTATSGEDITLIFCPRFFCILSFNFWFVVDGIKTCIFLNVNR